jgi:U3 small nucleolar RNA-associated protein 14
VCVCVAHVVVKAGWGDWAGPGATLVSAKILKTRDRLLSKVEAEDAQQRAKRRDQKIPNVILSDRRIKTAAKYKVATVPHPFTTMEEYERSLQMPIGGTHSTCQPPACFAYSCFVAPLVLAVVLFIFTALFVFVTCADEWNASHVVRSMTKPEIMLRAGRIIEPIQQPAKKVNRTQAPTPAPAKSNAAKKIK